MVMRILSKKGYPPDVQVHTTKTGLEQSGLKCEEWA